MNSEKISWCCKQKRGIELIEPKPHIEKSYIEESEKDLEESKLISGKWKIIISYYSCYEALYSLFMKCGIKSEIHDCTIELMNLFGFEDREIVFMKELKRLREGNQYYLKREEMKSGGGVKEFILKCKEISSSLNSFKIEEIRNKIRKFKDE